MTHSWGAKNTSKSEETRLLDAIGDEITDELGARMVFFIDYSLRGFSAEYPRRHITVRLNFETQKPLVRILIEDKGLLVQGIKRDLERPKYYLTTWETVVTIPYEDPRMIERLIEAIRKIAGVAKRQTR
jgi:hypothetical protein